LLITLFVVEGGMRAFFVDDDRGVCDGKQANWNFSIIDYYDIFLHQYIFFE
jgi:hypothetical protein